MLKTPLGVGVRVVPSPGNPSEEVVQLNFSLNQLYAIFPRTVRIPKMPVRPASIVAILVADIIADLGSGLVGEVRVKERSVTVRLRVGLSVWEGTYMDRVREAFLDIPGVDKLTFWLKNIGAKPSPVA